MKIFMQNNSTKKNKIKLDFLLFKLELIDVLFKQHLPSFLQEINKLTAVALKADVGMYPENKQKNRYVNIQACKNRKRKSVYTL